MAKFFQRLGSKKERFIIMMKIISLDYSVTEAIERISIEWKRGEKKSETKAIFELSPVKHLTQINETFSKSSVFYYQPKSQTYFKKLANIRVKGFTTNGKEKHMGEIDLDMSQYVGSQNELMTLTLNKTLPKTTKAQLSIQLSIVKDETAVSQGQSPSKAKHDLGGDAQQDNSDSDSSEPASPLQTTQQKPQQSPPPLAKSTIHTQLLNEIAQSEERLKQLHSQLQEATKQAQAKEEEVKAAKTLLEEEKQAIDKEKTELHLENVKLEGAIGKMREERSKLMMELQIEGSPDLEGLKLILEKLKAEQPKKEQA